MADRIDHFARMRAEAEPAKAPDADAPRVTPELIDYLERTWPDIKLGNIGFEASQDGVLFLAAMAAKELGRREVIDHLKLLSQGA